MRISPHCSLFYDNDKTLLVRVRLGVMRVRCHDIRFIIRVSVMIKKYAKSLLL